MREGSKVEEQLLRETIGKDGVCCITDGHEMLWGHFTRDLSLSLSHSLSLPLSSSRNQTLEAGNCERAREAFSPLLPSLSLLSHSAREWTNPLAGEREGEKILVSPGCHQGKREREEEENQRCDSINPSEGDVRCK